MAMNPRLLRPKASGFRYQSLRAGLVAYWPLNETAASGDVTARDESGRGNALTSNNSVLSVTGKVGNARQFTAANTEWLSANSNADLSLGDGDWTVTAWAWQATIGTDRMIVAKDVSGAREFYIFGGPAGTASSARFGISNTGGTFREITLTSVLSNSTWHFFAARKLGDVITFRVDTTTGSHTRTGGEVFAAANTPWNVGRRGFSGFQGYFTGYIDEVAKWSRGLSDAELNELYNSGNGINLGQRA